MTTNHWNRGKWPLKKSKNQSECSRRVELMWPFSFSLRYIAMFLAIIITSSFVPQKNLPADNSACPQGMLEYIRNNDETVLKGCDKVGIERKWMIILLFSKPDEPMWRERLVGKFFCVCVFFSCAWYTVSLVRRCYYSIINVFLLPRTRGDCIKIQATEVAFWLRHQTQFQCFTLSEQEWFTCMNNYTPSISSKCFCFWNKVLCFVFFDRFCLFTKQICCLQNQLLSCLMWQVSAMWFLFLLSLLSFGVIHMIPKWFSFWNEFIPSPYISQYLFTWYRSDI